MIITQVDVLIVIVYKKQTQLLVLLCYQGLLLAKIFVYIYIYIFFFFPLNLIVIKDGSWLG